MNAQRNAQQAPAAGLGRVDFRLLGPLEALVEEEPVALGPPKQRALLAQLLLSANEAVPVERLVDALWPEEPPPSARHAIQVYVSKLRGLLGGADRIEVRSRAYLLRADPDEVDLSRFRLLVADARDALAADSADGAAEGLREALALWRARALADLDGEPGVRELVLELEEEHVAAIELRVTSELQAGRGDDLIPELEQLVEEYPAREQLHGDLMLALHRAGRRDDALDAYGRARESLLNELGLEPSARLQELEAAIRRDDPALIPEPPELRARKHLPAQPNQFIGREREVDEIVELITTGGIRLETLTGTGGIGKTRLALAAAERLAARFEDGVWFVDLSSLSDPALVVGAVASLFGLEESADLEAHVADKNLLVVFDNFEQVADAAPLLSGLLRAAPRLALLVTSRSSLHLSGEHEYRVSPLPELEAVRLFATRARAVSRDFELTEANTGELAEICSDLDGLPLAIELAAATLKDFSPSELRARLEKRLHLLVGGPVDVPARQQTVRATIEWSYGLLAKDEQGLFARLAVFSGGWTAEAARTVCGATESTLSSLRDKGLIRSDGDRFAMLATIREFALERFESQRTASVVRKHAEYFAEIAESAKARGQTAGPDPKILDELGRDYENFRAALQSTHDGGETALFARLTAGLAEYWSVRGPHAEARRWLEASLANPPEDSSLHARVAIGLAMCCQQLGDYRAASQALSLALPLARSTGDRETEASTLGNIGAIELHLGNYARAREYLMQCQQLARELGNELTLAGVANVLGVLETLEERPEDSERWFEESLSIAMRIRNHEGAAIALLNLGLLALWSERFDDSRLRFEESLTLATDLQHPLQTAECIVGLAAVAAQRDDCTRAARLLGSMQALLDETAIELEPAFRELEQKTQAMVRARMGGNAANRAFEAGRTQRRGDALSYALQRGSDPVGV
jgi:predicted ATPase/DNA-binding SARP family transcriptional activator